MASTAKTSSSYNNIYKLIELVLDDQNKLVDIKVPDEMRTTALYISNSPSGLRKQAHAVKLAKRIIGLVEHRMAEPTAKLADLPNVVEDAIQASLDSNGFHPDPEDQTYTIPFSEAEAYGRSCAEAAKRRRSGLYEEKDAWWAHQEALLIKAIARKYFANQTKKAAAKAKATRLETNFSPADWEFIKDWLTQHVTNIYYEVPVNDDNSFVGNDLLTDEKAREDSHLETEARWASEINTLYNKFPALKNTSHIVERTVAGDNDPRKDCWDIAGFTKFDTKVKDMPEQVRRLIEIAKSRSAQDVKTMEKSASDYRINSMPLANKILTLFDGNPDFYKHADSDVPTAIDTNNTFSMDMPDYEPEPESDDKIDMSFDSDSFIKDYE